MLRFRTPAEREADMLKSKHHPTSKPVPKTEPCPKCGHPFDPERDDVIECPRCGVPGSTACCNNGGRGVMCAACEESNTKD